MTRKLLVWCGRKLGAIRMRAYGAGSNDAGAIVELAPRLLLVPALLF